MTIDHTLEGGTLTVRPQGRIDTLTAPDFEAAVRALLPDADSLVIDLTGVDYVSSAGLRAMLVLHKSAGADKKGMQVTHVSPAVMDVFAMTGFDKVLDIQ